MKGTASKFSYINIDSNVTIEWWAVLKVILKKKMERVVYRKENVFWPAALAASWDF